MNTIVRDISSINAKIEVAERNIERKACKNKNRIFCQGECIFSST